MVVQAKISHRWGHLLSRRHARHLSKKPPRFLCETCHVVSVAHEWVLHDQCQLHRLLCSRQQSRVIWIPQHGLQKPHLSHLLPFITGLIDEIQLERELCLHRSKRRSTPKNSTVRRSWRWAWSFSCLHCYLPDPVPVSSAAWLDSRLFCSWAARQCGKWRNRPEWF